LSEAVKDGIWELRAQGLSGPLPGRALTVAWVRVARA